MVTVHDVPPEKLIDKVSEELQGSSEIKPPEWAPFAKTGVHKEKSPIDADWWYKRTAAILRTIYLEEPIGISHLRSKFGGKQERGSKPPRAAKGSGSVMRNACHQLEDMGLVKKTEDGRVITQEGQSLLDNMAYDIMKDMVEDNPELSKYL